MKAAQKLAGDGVKFLGPLSNEKTCQEIALADFYVQLSSDFVTSVPGGEYVHSEGMGRSILEAISAGTFVIAGQCGALKEVVYNDRGVLLPLEEKTLTSKIEELIVSPPHRGAPTSCYSWEKLFLQYEKYYESLGSNRKM